MRPGHPHLLAEHRKRQSNPRKTPSEVRVFVKGETQVDFNST